jgi:hypothetical protein
MEPRISSLERRMDAVEREVNDLNMIVNIGEGDRPSLRSRVHLLESYNAASKAADAARDALKSAQAAAASRRERHFALGIALANVLIVTVGVLVAATIHH